MSQTITVFGATGNQGGSVIKHILADASLSKKFKIRAVTRDTTKPSAKNLSAQGVELVNADMNSLESLGSALKGSDTVFLVTNYWESGKPEVELRHGKNVVDAAKAAGVSHIIFSSLLHVTKLTNGRLSKVPHFDIKAEIEEYVRQSGITCAFILPGYFMSNYTQMLNKNADGSYTLAYPVSEKAQFPLFDAVNDTGKFVKIALKNPEKLNGKQILAATDYYTVDQILADFTEVTSKKATYAKVSPEQYTAFFPEAIGEEMLENHLFVENPGYYNGASLKETLDLLEDKPTTWKEFVQNTPAFN